MCLRIGKIGRKIWTKMHNCCMRSQKFLVGSIVFSLQFIVEVRNNSALFWYKISVSATSLATTSREEGKSKSQGVRISDPRGFFSSQKTLSCSELLLFHTEAILLAGVLWIWDIDVAMSTNRGMKRRKKLRVHRPKSVGDLLWTLEDLEEKISLLLILKDLHVTFHFEWFVQGT